MLYSSSGGSSRYKRALRIIGRYLNQRKARVILVAEIEEGYLLHFATDGRLDRLEGFAIHDDDLLDLEHVFRARRGDVRPAGVFAGMQSFFGFRRDEGLQFQRSHAVCPQGYEETLRTLGSRLDMQRAQNIMVTEMPHQIVLEYNTPVYGAAARSGTASKANRRNETYSRAALEELIAAERRRAAQAIVGAAERMRLDPNDHRLYMDAGRMFHDEGNFSEAADLYRMVVSLLPKHIEAYYRLAELNLERAQHREAIDWLNKALRLDPRSSRCHDLLGTAYRLADQPEHAVQAFQQAITLDPLNRTYRMHLAQVAPDAPFYVTPAPADRDLASLAGPLAGAQATAACGEASAQRAERLPSSQEEPPATRLGSLAARLGDNTLAPDEHSVEGDQDAVDQQSDGRPAASPGPSAVEPTSERSPDPWAEPAPAMSGGVDRSADYPRAAPVPEPAPATSGGVNPFEAGDGLVPAQSTPRQEAPPPPRPATVEVSDPGSFGQAPPDGDLAAAAHLSVSAVPEDSIGATIATLRGLLAAHPAQLDLHRKVGFLLARQGRTAEAAAEFARARGRNDQ